VRGCFHVEVVSFSRRIVSSRIPFVSCLYSIVFKNMKNTVRIQIYKIRLDTCVVSSILQYGVDTIRIQQTSFEYKKDTQLAGYVLVSERVRILSYSTHCSYPQRIRTGYVHKIQLVTGIKKAGIARACTVS
jgi:hypothetical protein